MVFDLHNYHFDLGISGRMVWLSARKGNWGSSSDGGRPGWAIVARQEVCRQRLGNGNVSLAWRKIMVCANMVGVSMH